MRVKLTIPLKLKPEGNGLEHWRVVSKRRKEQHAAVALMLRDYAPALIDQGFPVICTLIRVSAGKLDSDNLQSAFKAVRDAVARELGVDDGGDDVVWCYEQRKGARGVYEVVIEIEPLGTPRPQDASVNEAVKSRGRR